MGRLVFRRHSGGGGDEFVHGQPFTITGSGFGTKAAMPNIYSDWQGLSVGAAVTGAGWTEGGFHKPIVATDGLRSGTPFDRNVKLRWERGIASGIGGDVSQFILTGLTNTGGRYYLDFWNRMNLGSSTPYAQNIKQWRLHTPTAQPPNIHFSYNVNGDTGLFIGEELGPGQDFITANANWPPSYAASVFGGSAPGPGAIQPYTYTHNQWHHFQVLLNIGTAGGANGSYIVYADGDLVYNHHGDFPMMGTGDAPWSEIYIGNYVRSDDHVDVFAWWESVYFDASAHAWARVEIGDNATYANCTFREIQKPTSWSDGSITFVANRGQMAVSSTAHIFVADSTNSIQNVGSVEVAG